MCLCCVRLIAHALQVLMRECVDWYKLFPHTHESICLSVHNVPMGCRECLLLFILYVIFRGWRFVPPFHSDFLNFLPSGPQKKKSKRMFNIEREKTWRVEACPSKKLLRVTPCKDLIIYLQNLYLSSLKLENPYMRVCARNHLIPPAQQNPRASKSLIAIVGEQIILSSDSTGQAVSENKDGNLMYLSTFFVLYTCQRPEWVIL